MTWNSVRRLSERPGAVSLGPIGFFSPADGDDAQVVDAAIHEPVTDRERTLRAVPWLYSSPAVESVWPSMRRVTSGAPAGT
jgi:hypothetical protein